MPTTYTSLLRLNLPADGEDSGSWGDLVNNGITSLLDVAVAGYLSIAMSDADRTLTANNGASDQSRYACINFTGTLTAQRTINVPGSAKYYLISNNTTGGFGLNVQVLGGGGTATVVNNGWRLLLFCDGTNVTEAMTASHIFLLPGNNLSDLTSASTARTNLGLGTAAVQNVGAFLQPSNNLSDVASASTAINNIIPSQTGHANQFLTTNGSAVAWTSSGALLINNNLSDLNNAATARTNLGLGSAAVQNTSAFLLPGNNLSDVQSATSAINNIVPNQTGNSGKFLSTNGTSVSWNAPAGGFLLASNNLSDLTNVGTARTNLGLGSAALQASSFFLQAGNNLSDVGSQSVAQNNLLPPQASNSGKFLTTNGTNVSWGSPAGGFLVAANNLSDLASAATARTNLGLGTAATSNTSAFLQPSNNLSDVSNAATSRTNLGLGTASTQATGTFLQVSNELSDITNTASARSNLGLGTAATASTGTSGGTLPFLNGANTWSGANTFNSTVNLAGGGTITSYTLSGTTTLNGTMNTGGNAITSPVIQNGTLSFTGLQGFYGVGFVGVPITGRSANYTAISTDTGQESLFFSNATFTIPANSSVGYQVGTVLVASAYPGVTLTVACSDTLRLVPSNATGNRTVTGPGVLIAKKVGSTEWWVWGLNVT